MHGLSQSPDKMVELGAKKLASVQLAPIYVYFVGDRLNRVLSTTNSSVYDQATTILRINGTIIHDETTGKVLLTDRVTNQTMHTTSDFLEKERVWTLPIHH